MCFLPVYQYTQHQTLHVHRLLCIYERCKTFQIHILCQNYIYTGIFSCPFFISNLNSVNAFSLIIIVYNLMKSHSDIAFIYVLKIFFIYNKKSLKMGNQKS
jgi:hypothetical protein